MAKKKKTSWIVWLRRLTQTGFFLLFFYLFLQTVYHPINKAGRGVTFFFNLDPLVALNSWLASHAFVGAMLLSLLTLAVTFICGRWFCGWVCPFGALHNFFTSLRGGRAKAETRGRRLRSLAESEVLCADRLSDCGARGRQRRRMARPLFIFLSFAFHFHLSGHE